MGLDNVFNGPLVVFNGALTVNYTAVSGDQVVIGGDLTGDVDAPSAVLSVSSMVIHGALTVNLRKLTEAL